MKLFVAVRQTTEVYQGKRGYGSTPEYKLDEWYDGRISEVSDGTTDTLGSFEIPTRNASYSMRGILEPGRLKVIKPYDGGYWYVPMLVDAAGVARSVWPVMGWEFVIAEAK